MTLAKSLSQNCNLTYLKNELVINQTYFWSLFFKNFFYLVQGLTQIELQVILLFSGSQALGSKVSITTPSPWRWGQHGTPEIEHQPLCLPTQVL